MIGATVEPVMAATSDGDGRARWPKPEDLYGKKTPSMILAQKDDDVSFMPITTGGPDATSPASTPAGW